MSVQVIWLPCDPALAGWSTRKWVRRASVNESIAPAPGYLAPLRCWLPRAIGGGAGAAWCRWGQWKTCRAVTATTAWGAWPGRSHHARPRRRRAAGHRGRLCCDVVDLAGADRSRYGRVGSGRVSGLLDRVGEVDQLLIPLCVEALSADRSRSLLR